MNCFPPLIASPGAWAFGLLLSTAVACADAAEPVHQDSIPQTGVGMPAFDEAMLGTLKRYGAPGAALAIVKDGRLVVAKGYGWANVRDREPVRPTSLFSLASVSKPVSAIALLRLVQEGKLSLDDSVYDLLGRPAPITGRQIVPRVYKITVRDLLNHSAGWYRPDDPLGKARRIAKELKHPLPIPSELVIRYAFSHPLDFEPGTKQAYSNFAYQVVRHVVARAAGQPFEVYVREKILRSIGITDMRLEEISPSYALGEVHRYTAGGTHEFSGGRQPVGPPAGSWLASAVDMARFLTAIDGSRSPRLLDSATVDKMLAPPKPPLIPRKNGSYFGLGWDSVVCEPNGFRYGKNGGVDGISTYIEHRPDGVDWVILLNARVKGDDGPSALSYCMRQIRQAIDHVDQWPDRDLFVWYFRAEELQP